MHNTSNCCNELVFFVFLLCLFIPVHIPHIPCQSTSGCTLSYAFPSKYPRPLTKFTRCSHAQDKYHKTWHMLNMCYSKLFFPSKICQICHKIWSAPLPPVLGLPLPGRLVGDGCLKRHHHHAPTPPACLCSMYVAPTSKLSPSPPSPSSSQHHCHPTNSILAAHTLPYHSAQNLPPSRKLFDQISLAM